MHITKTHTKSLAQNDYRKITQLHDRYDICNSDQINNVYGHFSKCSIHVLSCYEQSYSGRDVVSLEHSFVYM